MTSTKMLTHFAVIILGAGFAGAASAQGSAGALPAGYGSAWAANQQSARTEAAATAGATMSRQADGAIRVSSRDASAN
jgi:hypothetical protein